jgi:endonuclease YncB( thermonuclease family)
LLGAAGGAGLVLVGLSTDLFGRAPPPFSRISAPAAQVAVVDGDTLRLRSTVVRLAGVQAPPRGQFCHDADARTVDCGGAAVSALAALIGRRDVACSLHGRDRMDRPLARCEAGQINLNRALVASGWARAETGEEQLAQAESEARSSHLGLWSGSTSTP